MFYSTAWLCDTSYLPDAPNPNGKDPGCKYQDNTLYMPIRNGQYPGCLED
jgi:hypothetical protein